MRRSLLETVIRDKFSQLLEKHCIESAMFKYFAYINSFSPHSDVSERHHCGATQVRKLSSVSMETEIREFP